MPYGEFRIKKYFSIVISINSYFCYFSAYLKKFVRESDVKFIIFAHHQFMLNAISECLNKLKVDSVRIDGKTSNDQRTDNVKRFQGKERCRAAILSLKACSAGITLTAASMVIFAELDWNPSVSRNRTIDVSATFKLKFSF